MEKLFFDSCSWNFGTITVILNDKGLQRIWLTEQPIDLSTDKAMTRDSIACKEIMSELSEYLKGRRTHFTIPLDLSGTTFQKNVWNILQNIPYGKTTSYGELATSLNNNHAARAVGQACRNNPLPIIIPCHRVLGKEGTLNGYLGNKLSIKQFLLELEK